MKIQVTEEHIKKGMPGWAESCPVALAIKEHYPPTYQITVYKQIHICRPVVEEGHETVEYEKCVETPPEVFQWIKKYDMKDGWDSKPIEFEI